MILVEFDDEELSRVYENGMSERLVVCDAKNNHFIIKPEDIEKLREKDIIFTIIKIG